MCSSNSSLYDAVTVCIVACYHVTAKLLQTVTMYRCMYVLTKYTLSGALTILELLTPHTSINLFSLTIPTKCMFYTFTVQSFITPACFSTAWCHLQGFLTLSFKNSWNMISTFVKFLYTAYVLPPCILNWIAAHYKLVWPKNAVNV